MKMLILWLICVLVCTCQQKEKDTHLDTTAPNSEIMIDTAEHIGRMIKNKRHPEALPDEILLGNIDSIPYIIEIAEQQKIEVDGSLINNPTPEVYELREKEKFNYLRIGDVAYTISGSVLHGLRPLFVKKAEWDSLKALGVK